jgi:hypothetical protein
LARLLGGGTLTELSITQPEQLLDGPSAALLGAALRANSTLTSLSFVNVDFWGDTDAAAALLSALTGHASLRNLVLLSNHVEAALSGAALGALIAANAPALTALDVSFCNLGDAGLRPLLDALPGNTNLRALDVSINGTSEAFARDVLPPAVRANASLQALSARTLQVDFSAREAETLVAARAAAA